jgi:hypothetical protein
MATPLVRGDGDAKLKNRSFAKPDNTEQPTTSLSMPQKVLGLRNGQKAQQLYGLPLCLILRSKVPEHGLEGSLQNVPCHQFSVNASERCLRINKRAAKNENARSRRSFSSPRALRLVASSLPQRGARLCGCGVGAIHVLVDYHPRVVRTPAAPQNGDVQKMMTTDVQAK